MLGPAPILRESCAASARPSSSSAPGVQVSRPRATRSLLRRRTRRTKTRSPNAITTAAREVAGGGAMTATRQSAAASPMRAQPGCVVGPPPLKMASPIVGACLKMARAPLEP